MPKTIGPHRETGTGPYRYQTANWKASIAVDDGDLVFQDTADLNASNVPYDKPAGSLTWTGALLGTQQAFRPLFRGVSTVRRTTLQTTAGDQVTDGGILASGEFTFPCAALAAAYIVGTLVTVAKASGNAIDPKKVVPTTDPSIAIGKLTVPAISGDTQLTFELQPATFADPAAPDTLTGTPAWLSAASGLTAFAGGGQGSATQLAAGINRVTTVATAADSVKLPASAAGMVVIVINAAAANAMNVFPATGDAINALSANTALSVAANKAIIFTCAVAGTWNSVLTA